MPTMDVFHNQLDTPGDVDNDVEITSHDINPLAVVKHEIHVTDRAPEATLAKKHETPPVEFQNATFIYAEYISGVQGMHLVNAQHTWKRRLLIRSNTANVYFSPLQPVDTITDPTNAKPPGFLVASGGLPIEVFYTGDLYFYFVANAQVSIYVEYCELAAFI